MIIIYYNIVNKYTYIPMDESPQTLSYIEIKKEKKEKKENKGEEDEFNCKKELYEKKKDTEYCVSLFGDNAQEGIEIINPINGNPYEHISEIPRKTKGTSKSDITILLKKTQEILHTSIKSKRGQMPTILNHTPRSANVFQLGYLKDEIINLDIVAKEYHDKRIKKSISEDVKLCKLGSYEIEHIKQSILNMLKYFIFIGSGKEKSTPECNSILIINKDSSKKYIPCTTEEEKEAYVNSVIDTCVLSFRNKGMRKKTCEQDLPWVCQYENKDYGAIHVRLSLK